MPYTVHTNASSQGNVNSDPYLRKIYGKDILIFPGWSHYELSSIPKERRRDLHRNAVIAAAERDKSRLPDEDFKAVFHDIDFDRETGEVLS